MKDDLRARADQIRSNFLQSTKDQQDMIDIANREEEPIYQNIQTYQTNASIIQDRFQQSKLELSIDHDSFICNKPNFYESLMGQSVSVNTQKTQCQNQTKNIQLKHENSEFQIEELNSALANERKQDYNDENINNNSQFLQVQKQNQLMTLQIVDNENNKSDLFISPTQNNTFFHTNQLNTSNNEQNSYKIQYFNDHQDPVDGLNGHWKKNPLYIIAKIKYFIQQMKKYSNTLKFQQMNQSQFQYINDVSSDYKFYYMNNLLSPTKIFISKWQKLLYSTENKFNLFLQNKYKLKQMIQTMKSGVIQPHSLTKILWELFLFISITWQIFYVPFYISFSSANSDTLNDEIFQNLLHIQIPIILFSDIIINFISAYYSKGKLEIRRVKIFYHYIQKVSKTIAEQYITSIYWAVITMITLGYGDFVPQTVYEKVFVIFITLISCGVFAYSVNQIGSIITNMTQQRLQFQQKIAQISGYLQERGVQSELLMRIKKNFAYLQRESVKDMEIHKTISTQLSKSLHTEVLRDIYIKVLQNQKFLQQLAPLLKERKFAPEEVIYEQGTTNMNLYFIIRGQVSLNFNLNGQKKQIKLLQKNDVFGEQSFFKQSIIDHTAISINVANLVYVNLIDFLSIIKDFQDDFEMYCMIKDKINLLSTTNKLGMKCYSCGQFQHQIVDCPFIYYLPNKEKILANHNLEIKQKRDPSFNGSRNYFEKNQKTIINQRQLKEEVINFIIEKNIYENLNELIEILKNQNIMIEETAPDINTEQMTLESQTQKSLKVLYPKKKIDNMTESCTISHEEILSPEDKKQVSSIKQECSMEFQKQISVNSPIINKFKRTQTLIIRTDSNNYNTSSKNLDHRDSNKKGFISVIQSQILKESSRKILIDEFESKKEINSNYNKLNSICQFPQQNISSNVIQYETSSINSSQNSKRQKQYSPYEEREKLNQNSQMIIQQINTRNPKQEHMNYMNCLNCNSQQTIQTHQQDKGNNLKKDCQEHHFRPKSCQTFQSQKNKICKFTEDEQRLIEISHDVLQNKHQKPNQNMKSNINPISQVQNSQLYNYSQLFKYNQDILNFEKMQSFKTYFPHNNYEVNVEKYNQYLKKIIYKNDSAIKKREKINLLRQNFKIFKGKNSSNSQNSHRNSRIRTKSAFNLNNKIVI